MMKKELLVENLGRESYRGAVSFMYGISALLKMRFHYRSINDSVRTQLATFHRITSRDIGCIYDPNTPKYTARIIPRSSV